MKGTPYLRINSKQIKDFNFKNEETTRDPEARKRLINQTIKNKRQSSNRKKKVFIMHMYKVLLFLIYIYIYIFQKISKKDP